MERRSSGPTRRGFIAGATVLLSGATASALGACRGVAGIDGTSRSPGAGGLAPATLTFTSWWTSLDSPWGIAMQNEVLPAFRQTYPEIKVEHVNIPSGQPGLEKLLALIAAGTPPDVTFVSPWSIPPLAVRGALVDLGPFIRRDEREFDSKDWFPKALAVGQWAAKTYGIPTDINVTNIYYNKTLFDAAGVKYPTDEWTYADYLAAAVRLTRGEGASRVWGTSLAEAPPHGPVIWANGGRLYDDKFTRSLLDQSPAVEALQWVADLRWRHAVAPRPDELAGTNERGLWEGGRLAMAFQGTHYLGNTRLRDVSFAWDVALPPKGKVKRAGLIRMALCTMLADSKQQGAAWLLVKHLSSPAAQRSWATTGSLMPARRSVAASQAFIRRPPAHVEKVVEAAEFAQGDEYHPRWAEANTMILEALTPVTGQGQQTAREAMASLVPRLNALLRQ